MTPSGLWCKLFPADLVRMGELKETTDQQDILIRKLKEASRASDGICSLLFLYVIRALEYRMPNLKPSLNDYLYEF